MTNGWDNFRWSDIWTSGDRPRRNYANFPPPGFIGFLQCCSCSQYPTDANSWISIWARTGSSIDKNAYVPYCCRHVCSTCDDCTKCLAKRVKVTRDGIESTEMQIVQFFDGRGNPTGPPGHFPYERTDGCYFDAYTDVPPAPPQHALIPSAAMRQVHVQSTRGGHSGGPQVRQAHVQSTEASHPGAPQVIVIENPSSPQVNEEAIRQTRALKTQLNYVQEQVQSQQDQLRQVQAQAAAPAPAPPVVVIQQKTAASSSAADYPDDYEPTSRSHERYDEPMAMPHQESTSYDQPYTTSAYSQLPDTQQDTSWAGHDDRPTLGTTRATTTRTTWQTSSTRFPSSSAYRQGSDQYTAESPKYHQDSELQDGSYGPWTNINNRPEGMSRNEWKRRKALMQKGIVPEDQQDQESLTHKAGLPQDDEKASDGQVGKIPFDPSLHTKKRPKGMPRKEWERHKTLARGGHPQNEGTPKKPNTEGKPQADSKDAKHIGGNTSRGLKPGDPKWPTENGKPTSLNAYKKRLKMEEKTTKKAAKQGIAIEGQEGGPYSGPNVPKGLKPGDLNWPTKNGNPISKNAYKKRVKLEEKADKKAAKQGTGIEGTRGGSHNGLNIPKGLKPGDPNWPIGADGKPVSKSEAERDTAKPGIAIGGDKDSQQKAIGGDKDGSQKATKKRGPGDPDWPTDENGKSMSKSAHSKMESRKRKDAKEAAARDALQKGIDSGQHLGMDGQPLSQFAHNTDGKTAAPTFGSKGEKDTAKPQHIGMEGEPLSRFAHHIGSKTVGPGMESEGNKNKSDQAKAPLQLFAKNGKPLSNNMQKKLAKLEKKMTPEAAMKKLKIQPAVSKLPGAEPNPPGSSAPAQPSNVPPPNSKSAAPNASGANAQQLFDQDDKPLSKKKQKKLANIERKKGKETALAAMKEMGVSTAPSKASEPNPNAHEQTPAPANAPVSHGPISNAYPPGSNATVPKAPGPNIQQFVDEDGKPLSNRKQKKLVSMEKKVGRERAMTQLGIKTKTTNAPAPSTQGTNTSIAKPGVTNQAAPTPAKTSDTHQPPGPLGLKPAAAATPKSAPNLNVAAKTPPAGPNPQLSTATNPQPSLHAKIPQVPDVKSTSPPKVNPKAPTISTDPTTQASPQALLNTHAQPPTVEKNVSGKVDPKPANTAKLDAKKTDPKADLRNAEVKVDPKKVDAKVDPKTTDAKLTGARVDPKKTETKPIDVKVDLKKADAKPVDTKPDLKKADTKPADVKIDPKKVDGKRMDSKVDPKKADGKPTDPKNGNTKPVDPKNASFSSNDPKKSDPKIAGTKKTDLNPKTNIFEQGKAGPSKPTSAGVLPKQQLEAAPQKTNDDGKKGKSWFGRKKNNTEFQSLGKPNQSRAAKKAEARNKKKNGWASAGQKHAYGPIADKNVVTEDTPNEISAVDKKFAAADASANRTGKQGNATDAQRKFGGLGRSMTPWRKKDKVDGQKKRVSSATAPPMPAGNIHTANSGIPAVPILPDTVQKGTKTEDPKVNGKSTFGWKNDKTNPQKGNINLQNGPVPAVKANAGPPNADSKSTEPKTSLSQAPLARSAPRKQAAKEKKQAKEEAKANKGKSATTQPVNIRPDAASLPITSPNGGDATNPDDTRDRPLTKAEKNKKKRESKQKAKELKNAGNGNPPEIRINAPKASASGTSATQDSTGKKTEKGKKPNKRAQKRANKKGKDEKTNPEPKPSLDKPKNFPPPPPIPTSSTDSKPLARQETSLSAKDRKAVAAAERKRKQDAAKREAALRKERLNAEKADKAAAKKAEDAVKAAAKRDADRLKAEAKAEQDRTKQRERAEAKVEKDRLAAETKTQKDLAKKAAAAAIPPAQGKGGNRGKKGNKGKNGSTDTGRNNQKGTKKDTTSKAPAAANAAKTTAAAEPKAQPKAQPKTTKTPKTSKAAKTPKASKASKSRKTKKG